VEFHEASTPLVTPDEPADPGAVPSGPLDVVQFLASLPEDIHGFNEGLNSLSAAEAPLNLPARPGVLDNTLRGSCYAAGETDGLYLVDWGRRAERSGKDIFHGSLSIQHPGQVLSTVQHSHNLNAIGGWQIEDEIVAKPAAQRPDTQLGMFGMRVSLIDERP
jgi:hypothetical protein